MAGFLEGVDRGQSALFPALHVAPLAVELPQARAPLLTTATELLRYGPELAARRDVFDPAKCSARIAKGLKGCWTTT
jgi:hypothetical protein